MPARVMQGLFVTAVGEELKKKKKKVPPTVAGKHFLEFAPVFA